MPLPRAHVSPSARDQKPDGGRFIFDIVLRNVYFFVCLIQIRRPLILACPCYVSGTSTVRDPRALPVTGVLEVRRPLVRT